VPTRAFLQPNGRICDALPPDFAHRTRSNELICEMTIAGSKVGGGVMSRQFAFASPIIAALAVSISVSALLTPSSPASAETCLAGPKGVAPEGSWWKYRLDRATQRKCWRLVKADEQPRRTAARTVPQPAPQPEGDDDTDTETVAATPNVKPAAERLSEATPQRLDPISQRAPDWTSRSASAITPETVAPVTSTNTFQRVAERADDQATAPSPAPAAPAVQEQTTSAPAGVVAAPSAAPESPPPAKVVRQTTPVTPAGGPGMIQFVFVAVGLGLLAGAVFLLLGVRRRRTDVLNRISRDDEDPSQLPEADDAPTFAAMPPMRMASHEDDLDRPFRRSSARTRLAG
jgi:hypothetical protein